MAVTEPRNMSTNIIEEFTPSIFMNLPGHHFDSK